MGLYNRILEAKHAIEGFVPDAAHADIGIVLGSGLGGLADHIADPLTVPFNKIPHFPRQTVKGHAGKLIFGTLGGKRVVAMAGRSHLYQGFSAAEVAFPIYVLKWLGCRFLILSNAAGGLPNKHLLSGDLMLIKDHINEMGTNPLIGYEEDERIGPLFVPMTHAYDERLLRFAKVCAKKEKIKLKEGIYVALHGPSFETKAEVAKLSKYASAVGMSTVPEVIVANQMRLPVLAISCITNVHNNKVPPTHQEVLETGKKSEERFVRLVKRIVHDIPVLTRPIVTVRSV